MSTIGPTNDKLSKIIPNRIENFFAHKRQKYPIDLFLMNLGTKYSFNEVQWLDEGHNFHCLIIISIRSKLFWIEMMNEYNNLFVGFCKRSQNICSFCHSWFMTAMLINEHTIILFTPGTFNILNLAREWCYFHCQRFSSSVSICVCIWMYPCPVELCQWAPK